jgi:hypothetical protein
MPGLTNCILLSIFVFVPSDSENEVEGKIKELNCFRNSGIKD